MATASSPEPSVIQSEVFGDNDGGENVVRRSVSSPSFSARDARRKTAPGKRSERRPYHYEQGESGRQNSLTNRYRYYSRLDPGQSLLGMPDHVVPFNFFSINPFLEERPDAKQSSVVTIFSIWNTMMGTALLTMPWALEQAGFVFGLFLMLSVAAIAFYTAYRVVESPRDLGLPGGMSVEFSDVCRYFWGRRGELVAIVFSMFVLLGGCIVYWVLMSNFLYHTGTVIYTSVNENSTEKIINLRNNTVQCDVLCLNVNHNSSKPPDAFYKYWDLRHSVPFFLAFLAFPLLNFESPTFFTKFNGLGTVSVIYLIIFVTVKAGECGIHLDFSAPFGSEGYIPIAKWTFPALTGTLTLSYFIHNCILSILRNQKKPENNSRDLTFAYILVASTYIFIAFMLYAAFPLRKSCIEDNFLNNFKDGDVLSSIARLFLLFQMLVVFPMLVYLIRAQLSWSILGKTYPGLKWVLLCNAGVVSICILFAVFMPTVGAILRFVGSMSGLVYIFSLPCAVHLSRLKMQGRLSWPQICFHGFLVLLGIGNFIAQFAILGVKKNPSE